MPTENLQAHIVSSHCERILAQPGLSVLGSSPPLGSEFDLLLACCSNKVSALNGLLELQLSWDRVFRLAEHHRVLPALFFSLRDRDDVPGSIQSAIRARIQKHIHRVLRFSAELASIAQHFAASGIPMVAHKGPALAQSLYADPGMRQFGDLDLLIAKEDIPRATAALVKLGYEQRLQLTPRQNKAYLQSGYEYVFGLGTERNLLELQWRIVPHFYAIDFDMNALLDRSVELQLDGSTLRTLGAEDLMMVLCVHAAKHEWAQLGMIRDIAALARSPLNWCWIRAEAQRLGILRILSTSLGLVQDLFECKIPEELRGGNASAVEQFCRVITPRIEKGVEINPESVDYFMDMMRLRERWQDRARFAWRLATTPGVGEWQSVKLPDSLFHLYRYVRGLRLLRRLSGLSAN